jgi:hypothetical protein
MTRQASNSRASVHPSYIFPYQHIEPPRTSLTALKLLHMPLAALDSVVTFLKGHISLKNCTQRLILRQDTMSFKRTCFLIRLLKVLPDRTGAIVKDRKETYLRQLSVCQKSNQDCAKACEN